MTTDTTPAAVQQLRDIREQWGDLLAAIDQPPAQQWPPAYDRAWERPPSDDGPQIGRLPLTLREHPAPLNLDALDAACAIETALFDLADRIAASIQASPASWEHATAEPDRWYFAGVRDVGRAPAWSPGSRALGLHWAVCWIEQRLAQTTTTGLGLHAPVRGVLRAHAERVTAEAHRLLLAALGRDGRDTVLPAPCPWCGGQLTARTTSGDPMAAVVTCGTGPTCTAPAPYDTEARRTWRDADLCGLYGALSAAERRATA